MKKYYYSTGNEQKGPVSFEELRNIGISNDTKIWHNELENWTEAKRIPELSDLFKSIPPPLPKIQDKQKSSNASKPKEVFDIYHDLFGDDFYKNTEISEDQITNSQKKIGYVTQKDSILLFVDNTIKQKGSEGWLFSENEIINFDNKNDIKKIQYHEIDSVHAIWQKVAMINVFTVYINNEYFGYLTTPLIETKAAFLMLLIHLNLINRLKETEITQDTVQLYLEKELLILERSKKINNLNPFIFLYDNYLIENKDFIIDFTYHEQNENSLAKKIINEVASFEFWSNTSYFIALTEKTLTIIKDIENGFSPENMNEIPKSDIISCDLKNNFFKTTLTIIISNDEKLVFKNLDSNDMSDKIYQNLNQ